MEKARTIDELLKDSSDEVIDINDAIDEEIDKSFSDVRDLDEDEFEESSRQEEKHEESLEDDTLENDLFDLIDSMYENREEEK